MHFSEDKSLAEVVRVCNLFATRSKRQITFWKVKSPGRRLQVALGLVRTRKRWRGRRSEGIGGGVNPMYANASVFKVILNPVT